MHMCTRIGPCSIRNSASSRCGSTSLPIELTRTNQQLSAFAPFSLQPWELGLEIMESWSDIAVDMLNYVCTIRIRIYLLSPPLTSHKVAKSTTLLFQDLIRKLMARWFTIQPTTGSASTARRTILGGVGVEQ